MIIVPYQVPVTHLIGLGFPILGGNMPFAKLDEGIIRSSIWFEPAGTVKLWITFLALKDENGFVATSRQGLKQAANITQEEFDKGLNTLESPDPDSRTPDNEGRRVAKIEGGWVVLNHEKYRDSEQSQRVKTKERVKRFREKQRVTQSVTLHNVTKPLPSVSVSVSVSDSVSVKKEECEKETKPKPEKTWRNDFETYKAECLVGYWQCKDDKEWIATQEKYDSKMDVMLSLEKSFETYWGTEEGWAKKKKDKSIKLNWKTTFSRTLKWSKVCKLTQTNQTSSTSALSQMTPQERLTHFQKLSSATKTPTHQSWETTSKTD
jgi:hypothetical protein